MKLQDIINEEWLNIEGLSKIYSEAKPFPHIVMNNFIRSDALKKVVDEFPDLSRLQKSIKHDNSKEIKFASSGMGDLSPSALHLNGYLQSDLFLNWLNNITGIKEPLISDPYLFGGGYHEIKRGGLLKVHADFNKHGRLNLDRRLNLLIYLNEKWDDDWGGALELFDEKMDVPVQRIYPRFNTAVIFNTTSYTYHGHPDPLLCPEERSRRSMAYYYFSTGRPDGEVKKKEHGTLFMARTGEKFESNLKSLLIDITPPILIRLASKFRRHH